MKIKVSEATNLQLNRMVAEYENKMWLAYENALCNETPLPTRASEYLRDSHPDAGWTPTTDWAQGGPIIEREISLIKRYSDNSGWYAQMMNCTGEGPTPLIAAMRCFVASKLGDDVEVPEDFT